MKDRIPANPGRVLVTPENGGAAYYATLTRADNPTQEGTPLNKANLLTDATAALFGFGADAVPNDILAAIKTLIDANADAIANGLKIETGSYTGTGTYGSNNKNSVTLGGVPKLFLVSGNVLHSPYIYGSTDGVSFRPSTGNTIVFSLEGTKLSWYTNATGDTAVCANHQANTSGYTYRYVAIY